MHCWIPVNYWCMLLLSICLIVLNILDYYLADYLNPVSKEEIVQECGLRSATGHRSDAAPPTDYYITTIDPIELGINMSSSQDEDQILFEDDFNLNYFGNNIMTWRRAVGASNIQLMQQQEALHQQQQQQQQLGEIPLEVVAIDASGFATAEGSLNHDQHVWKEGRV